jgi:SSS family solute:Na+ symporter
MSSLAVGLLFIGSSCLYALIGFILQRRVSSLDDYFLAGRQLSLFPLTVSLIATQLGGGVILSTSAEAYTKGWYGLIYVMSISIGMLILGLGLASRMRQIQVATTAQIFQTCYQSPTLRRIAAICFMAALGGILTGQVIACKNLLISYGLHTPWLFTLLWLLLVGYATMGGFAAVVSNDIIQLTIIMAAFVGIFIYHLFTAPFSFSSVAATAGMLAKKTVISWPTLASISIAPALFCLIEQDIAQSLFAAKNRTTALLGSLCAAICLSSFALIPLYFGIGAHLANLSLTPGSSPLMSYLATTYSSAVMLMVGYGILAAIISTANSLLCALSAHMVRDLLSQSTANAYALTISKLTTFCIGIGAFLLAQTQTNILTILIKSYEIPVGALAVSILAAYLLKKPSRLGAWLSVSTGLLITFGYMAGIFQTSFSCELLALIASGTSYCLGTLLEKKVFKTAPSS